MTTTTTAIDNQFSRKTMTSPTSVLLQSSSSSPSNKALGGVRAATLKRRFAAIISKATAYQITNERGYGFSASVRLEKQLLKKQREKDRAASRKALQRMKKTVHIYEDAETLEEIERVRCLQIFGSDDNPLELLGLYLKKDYMKEEEEELRYMNCEDLEEGEIVSYSCRSINHL